MNLYELLTVPEPRPPKLDFQVGLAGSRSIQSHMSMYLAIILGFCALTMPSFAALAQAQPPLLNQETQPAPDAAPAGSPQETQEDAPSGRMTRRRIGAAQSSSRSAQPGAEPQSEPASPPETKPQTAPEPQKAQTEPAAKKPESKHRRKRPQEKAPPENLRSTSRGLG